MAENAGAGTAVGAATGGASRAGASRQAALGLPGGGRPVGRVWRPGIGPALVTIRAGSVIDVTAPEAPTMRDLLEMDDPAGWLDAQAGERVCAPDDLAQAGQGADDLRLLSPADLQAIKASGVTFADSMVERVIEEQAAGDPDRAGAIRARIGAAIGANLRGIVPGSPRAAEVRRALQAEGLWSQYLEVGIGPDAEIFTKCQPMASVGWGADVGLHPISRWNNPEPEIVLAVDSRGRIKGATLGNDVNLRDVEGRSALLLGKAKDNNASAAIGPFIRLFDETYGLDDVRRAELTLRVEGADGFVLQGASSMARISRDPADLVAQACGRHHQYPDGFMLYLGTLFAPTQDRDAPGQGFTHHRGDVVTIAEPSLGALVNRVALSTECPEWTFGAGALMRNLAGRGLLG
ncbi:fumarylacetoacetate hydrolase family protein [Paracoccus luteus]|uniref:fumarylacetoacetate hydrolase family protein n=1 Tax=Paracoccus luteus TaxID=2508543 RepID=UPI00107020CC|nr:fumarylacetoacetate hydrolase family protein [Paracoccus luteus]